MVVLIRTNIADVLACVAAAAIDRLPTDDDGFLRRGAIEIEAADLDGFGAIQKSPHSKEIQYGKSCTDGSVGRGRRGHA
jgi:hypothetical protein